MVLAEVSWKESWQSIDARRIDIKLTRYKPGGYLIWIYGLYRQQNVVTYEYF
jgi:hypothetical protein